LRYLERSLGRRCGGSTGTNFVAALHLAREMHHEGEEGAIVTVLCDGGERYLQTYYDDGWLAARNIDIAPAVAAITACATHGDSMPWTLVEHACA
jgi:cysteine synthase A